MAVGLENGLLTPVVKNAEKMSLRELMISLKDLTKKVKGITTRTIKTTGGKIR